MATTGFWPVKDWLKEVIDYADNPNKTTDKKYLDNPALFAEMERRKNTCRLDASKKLSVQIGFDGKNASANLHSLENFLLALS